MAVGAYMLVGHREGRQGASRGQAGASDQERATGAEETVGARHYFKGRHRRTW